MITNEDTILYAGFVGIVLIILFILFFALLLRAFDYKFNAFLNTSLDNEKAIGEQLSFLYDAILILGTMIKPSCVDVLLKYIHKSNNVVLRDMHQCSKASTIACQGFECCCNCSFQRILYVLTGQEEELKMTGILCAVGDIDILIAEHGHCPLYKRKK